MAKSRLLLFSNEYLYVLFALKKESFLICHMFILGLANFVCNEYMYVRKYSLPISSLLSGLFGNAESLMTRSVRVRKIRV